MKTVCVLTTINVPRVLALYAKCDPNVFFIVIGDRKTPDLDVVNFLTEYVPNHAYYGIDRQHALGYRCSQMLGENCIQRRNIGFLEALRYGADVIVSIDDDNIPMANEYFANYFGNIQLRLGTPIDPETGRALGNYFNGLKATSPSNWFDVGQLLRPRAEHRGFPYDKRATPVFEPVVDARIGVAAGICLGDPDIGAVERIANAPTVHGVSELLRGGIVTDPAETWTVFNSQNTAFLRELTPAMFMLPHVGRYDDIYASLICQRVMREQNLHVHFGPPFVWQQRNVHDLTKDLAAELMGMKHVVPLAHKLDAMPLLDHDSVFQQTLEIYARLDIQGDILPGASTQAALAWLDDVQQILGKAGV